MQKARKNQQVAPAYDWRTELRTQLHALGLEALENYVATQSQQAKTENFMAHGYSMSARNAERHAEKMMIAHEVLAERYKVVAEMVEDAYWEKMEQIADAVDFQIAHYESEDVDESESNDYED